MTHRSILTSIWTSVLAVLMAVLSGFGLAAKSAPAAAVSAPAGTEGAEATAVRRPADAARRSWRAMMRGGSLPPTIKQRIRAEAHGKTPPYGVPPPQRPWAPVPEPRPEPPPAR